MPDDAPVYPNPPPPPRGPNNRVQLERVSRNGQMLQNILDDPEALALASKRKQNAKTLAPLLALADAFLREYGERDDATGTQSGSRLSLTAANAAARSGYNDLRSTLRTLYAGQREHLERLGVSRARAAGDRDTFLGEARATLTAVRDAPYAAAVADYEYDEAALDALAASIDALQQAARRKVSATGGHGGSTQERNAAYADFMKALKPTRGFLRLAFKGHPDVAARVGFTAPGL